MRFNFQADKRFTITGLIIIVFIIIAGRTFYIQVIDRSYGNFRQASNVLRYVTKYPARGLIFDRNGNLLVSNKVVYDLMMVKKQVIAFDTMAFASLLNITTDHARDAFVLGFPPKVSHANRLCCLSRLSGRGMCNASGKAPVSGFEAAAKILVRLYDREVASHVLGYIGRLTRKLFQKIPTTRLGRLYWYQRFGKIIMRNTPWEKVLAFTWLTFTTASKGSYEDGKYDSA